jgi:predicted nucleotidyltransferase component of viral defense system
MARLLHLVERINRDKYLTNRLALKGGTAIHHFHLEAPRLSVDLDFNYLGSAGREAMLAERPELERRLQELLIQEEYTIHRVPGEHAGGKWRLRYGACLELVPRWKWIWLTSIERRSIL